MPEQFLHGVEVVELPGGVRPIRTVRTGVIGIVGTAPEADAAAFPVNTPVLIAGSRLEAAALGARGAGTLPGAVESILDQIGAVIVVVRVEAGADEDETLANVVGGVDANTDAYLGVHALVGAESVVGFEPKILLAPGFTHQRADDGQGAFLKNPVAAELEGIADRLDAIVVADCPNTTDADAISYADDFGQARVWPVAPWVKVLGPEGAYIDEPASAAFAGVIARTDADEGFWVSPSNKPINGIVGTSRPVSFKLGDTASRANLLNEEAVATTIRKDGFRTWGNRVPTSDPQFQFLSVRRTADAINASLRRAHMWAVDRGITRTYLDDVSDSVNGYLSQLTALGAILGGRCYPDPDLNNAQAITEGRVYFNVEYTPVYPAERVVFRVRIVNDYIEELV